MRITVLGKSPAWQDTGGSCSGYLVEHGGFVLLLDCGNGVFAQLRRHIDYLEIDAVLITHLHGDHFLDLVPYSYALIYAPRQQPVAVAGWPGTDDPVRPELHLPPGSTDTFRRLSATFGPADLIESAFEIREYDGGSELAIGPFRIRLTEVPHYTRTFAVDFTDPDGARFTFSADCRPNDELVELARDTDLLLIEATLPRPERNGTRGHLTPGEAGEHARRAGARNVVLTHFSDELDPSWMAAEAAATFGSAVTLAEQGAVYTPQAADRPRAVSRGTASAS
ncbi:MAG TPA: MBL fold metallo-hydrolase [Solirubrobacteraceae bacterium]|nr:MBL fold metallo-hydrolase [Solirubrobacteraceae bacterium]